jgi:hypothetical protein
MSRRFVLMVLGCAAVLAVGFTWPLAAQLRTHVGGRSVDAEQFLWSFWWFRRAIVGEHISPFVTGLLYYPEGVSLRYFTTNTLNALIAVPLQQLVGLVPAFNLIGLATFVAIFLTSAWLAYDVSGSRAGALFAGAAVAFAPMQVFHWRVGQYNMLSVEFVPLYILCLRRLALADAWSWRAVLGGAASLACAALCDWQFALFLALFTSLATILLLAERPRRWRLTLGQIALACALAVAVLLPLILPMLGELNSDTPYMLRKETDTIYHSADVAMFLVPNPASPLWGGWAGQQLKRYTDPGIIPTTVSLSYVTLALALVGIVAWRRRVAFWLVTGAAFWVLALGPRLKWFGTTTDIPLPYLLLFQSKLVQISRFPARYALFTQIALAMLAALGIAALLRRAPTLSERAWRLRAGLAGLAGLALLAELAPAPRYAEPLARVPAFFADGTLAQAGALLEQPNPSNRGMYFQTFHGRPVLWGELSRDNPVGPLVRMLRKDPLNGNLEIFDRERNWVCLAGAAGFTHLVRYDAAKHPDVLPGTTPLAADAGAALFSIPPPAPGATCLALGDGWYDARPSDGGPPYRWIDQHAQLGIFRQTPLRARLTMQVQCFALIRHVQVRQGDRVLAERPDCKAQPQPMQVDLDLPAGWTWLDLASVEPASVPADYGYDDTIPISAGFSQLVIEPR